MINGLLTKEPERRPDAAEVRRLLQEAVREPQPTQGVPLTVPGGRGLRPGRKALFGIGAAVVAAAAVIALVVADPFAGPLPDGWKQHREKALGATLAVPANYRVYRPEKDDTDKNWVTYSDLSGSISVVLHLARRSEDSSHQIKDSSAAEMYAENGEFKDSGAYELQMASGPKKTHPEEIRYRAGRPRRTPSPIRRTTAGTRFRAS